MPDDPWFGHPNNPNLQAQFSHGETPHFFEAGFTGMTCEKMILRDGFGDTCGKSADDLIHTYAKETD